MGRTGTLILVILIYALAIGAAVFYGTVMGAGEGVVIAVGVGLAIHAALYFAVLGRAPWESK